MRVGSPTALYVRRVLVMAAVMAPAFEWRADAADGDRHAFPQREDIGLPFPALCGIRWTVRFGEHGARWCDACLARLKAILSDAQEALIEAEFTNSSGDLDAWGEAEKREAFGG